MAAGLAALRPLQAPSSFASVASLLAASLLFLLFLLPLVLSSIGLLLGWTLRRRTDGRRCQLSQLMRHDAHPPPPASRPAAQTTPDAAQDSADWAGFVGFFHPFCNAGGGGERVLWAAIRATQTRWPRAKCIVYTGDNDVNKEAILLRVQSRFNIHLHPATISFLYLSKRHWVLPSTWPYFTLLGQSIGSLVLAWDAFSLLVPDIFVDTMGYAFALGLCRLLFRSLPTGAYVHYPTISTDMLDSLNPASAVGSQGVNAGQGTGIRGIVKTVYWCLFARLYSWVGSSVDVVMTNSTWTQAHIQRLWGPYRKGWHATRPITVVYPPVAVTELEEEVEVSEASEAKREKILIYIAQFRPEKNHQLILQSYSRFLRSDTDEARSSRLVLVGSVRDDHDSKRVYQLRLLANELGIRSQVDFHLDASWPEILTWLRKAYVGVNGMWNEHFGIGVVEYQAAGLISVVHDSGGPKLDIVTEMDGKPTGFLATSEDEFAVAYQEALSHPDPLALRRRARKSAQRFTEDEFANKWLRQMEDLVSLAQ